MVWIAHAGSGLILLKFVTHPPEVLFGGCYELVKVWSGFAMPAGTALTSFAEMWCGIGVCVGVREQRAAKRRRQRQMRLFILLHKCHST